MKTRSIRRELATLLTFCLIGVACGSDEPATTSTTSTATTTTTTTTADGSASSTTTEAEGTTTTTSQAPASETIQVFFAPAAGDECGQVAGFDRTIDTGLDPVVMAFQFLVAGPTAEEMGAGAGSMFSAESEGAILALRRDNGLLTVDFRDVRLLLANASTSCGSESLLAQINATAFQFDSVARVRYEIEGSCDLFSNWLQRECMEYTRAGAEPAPASTNERALGSGCSPGTDNLPDGRWFGYVTDAGTDDVVFDLACWFIGSAAADAAAEDGEESPPPNDYYIRNVSDLLRSVPVDGSTLVTWLPTGDPADVTTGTYADWVAGRASRSYLPGVWLEVAGSRITLIEEQYVP